MGQVTSALGRAIIESFEGCMKDIGGGLYAPYYDEVHVLTQGFGHTNLGNVAPTVVLGTNWTRAQCDEALSNDLVRFESAVGRVMAGIPLTQSQFDALVSFDFNTGSLANSSISRKMRGRDLNAACATLAMYNHAGGRVLAGLTRRRNCEVALMRGDVPGACKLAGIPAPTTNDGASA